MKGMNLDGPGMDLDQSLITMNNTMKSYFNPVLFMSLFGHALFIYNPPKHSREVWWFFELIGITLEHMKRMGLSNLIIATLGETGCLWSLKRDIFMYSENDYRESL